MHGGSPDEDMHNQVWGLEDQSKFSAKKVIFKITTVGDFGWPK